MRPLGLSFQQAPPLSVPFRFFLTAPLFLVGAALLLILEGGSLFISRHALITLAATHLVTLGFASMVMCGALLQILPVLGGNPVRHSRKAAWLIHPLLVLGSLGVPAALLESSPWLMLAAATCLLLGFGLFAGLIFFSSPRAKGFNPSVAAFRLAVLSLMITVTLGISLGLARFWGVSLNYTLLAEIHPLWGIYGWMTLLIMGVSYQIVPMFQLTRQYPEKIRTWLVPALFLMLVAHSLAAVWPARLALLLEQITDSALALGAILFGCITLYLQYHRKRKIADATDPFWKIGMTCLVMGGLIGGTGWVFGQPVSESLSLALGILLIVGFVFSIINGMIYRIVPFLTWFHLQSAYPHQGIVPNVRQIQAGFYTSGQMSLFLVALLLLIAACWVPQLARLTGLLWLLNALWLEINLLKALTIYFSTSKAANRPK
jgi:hypothetical protein